MEQGMHGFSRAGSLAVMAVLGILCLLLHPVAIGPAIMTHGPATAFRALTAARQVFASIRAAIGIPAGIIHFCMQPETAVPNLAVTSASLYALRC